MIVPGKGFQSQACSLCQKRGFIYSSWSKRLLCRNYMRLYLHVKNQNREEFLFPIFSILGYYLGADMVAGTYLAKPAM
jgi:hypothetical protein